MSKSRLVIIDGSNYFYRAFYAIRFLASSKGVPTNAVYGFTRMLLKIMNQEKPDYLAIAFDVKSPTFRHKQFSEYKANRSAMPDGLSRQIPYIKQVVDAFNIPRLEIPGFEADDIIGTIASKAAREKINTLIVSGDKDTWQLVDKNTQVLDDIRGEVYDVEKIREKTGLSPRQLIDMAALSGDSSDNIPGVPGIGKKTAIALIREFDDLDNLLANVDKVSGKARREKLVHYADQAHLSRRLVTIDTQAPVEFDWEELRFSAPDYRKSAEIFQELELFSLMDQLSPNLIGQSKIAGNIVRTQEQFEVLLEQLTSAPRFAFALHSCLSQPLRGELAGISVAYQPGEGYYIPLAHNYKNVPPQLDKDKVLLRLKPLLENADIKKSVTDIKTVYLILAHYGIKPMGIDFDPRLASYLLNSGKSDHSLAQIVLEQLNRKLSGYEEIVGKGAREVCFDKITIPVAGRYGAEVAEAVYNLAAEMLVKLEQQVLGKLLTDMEIPLARVLADMESVGIRLDTEFLEKMSVQLDKQLSVLEERIYFLAGEKFNIDSPKQLSYILFERLGLPALKKTKTGYSTNIDVLQKLALFHPMAAEVLEYRSLRKLKGTYVDALPALVNAKTGRLHTSLNQMVTATGRLSSSDPNLQNIPIRTELGREIRRAFIPAEGCLLVSADYSQVELRLMAHFSEDENFLSAFAQGEDIHKRTAMEVFQVAEDKVTAELRRRAKGINFGILYGISAYGLAKEIKVGQKEAQHYIESYFARHPQIMEFIHNTVARARHDGYTTTLFGRRRYLPELKSKDKKIQQFGERMAINAPIQGTAADIIKLSMVGVHKELTRSHPASRLLLQVHDELLFEVPESELESVSRVIKEGMEGVVKLLVPLEVKIKSGFNWTDI